MKKKLIAQRYARAFVANLADLKDSSVSEDIELLQQIFDSAVIAKVSSKLLQKADKLQILQLISQETQNSELWTGFLQLLLQKQRLEVIPDILSTIDQILLAAENKQRVSLTLAHEQAPELLDAIKAKVSDILGKEIIVSVQIDPAIIGGFEVKAGNREINASIRSGLEKFVLSR